MDLISMYRDTLVSGFVNISVYFNKLANNFKPLDRFFKRIKILLAILIQTGNSVVSHFFIFIPIAKCYLSYSVLRMEMILESYAKVYFNQFTTGNSPFQLVQCSIVPNQKNCKHVNYSSHARQPL